MNMRKFYYYLSKENLDRSIIFSLNTYSLTLATINSQRICPFPTPQIFWNP